MKHLILSTILLSSTAIASDFTTIVHLTSKHFDDDLNERNLGIGIGYNITENIQARVGTYHNSYDNQSIYGGLYIYTNSYGVQIGPVTGYDDYKYMVLPTISIPLHNRLTAELGIIPSIDGVGIKGFTLSISF